MTELAGIEELLKPAGWVEVVDAQLPVRPCSECCPFTCGECGRTWIDAEPAEPTNGRSVVYAAIMEALDETDGGTMMEIARLLNVDASPMRDDDEEDDDGDGDRPTETCGCGYELIYVDGDWEHNTAPSLWGVDHDVDVTPEMEAAAAAWDAENPNS